MGAAVAILPASAETLVFREQCFLSIFDANQPQFLYQFPTIRIWLVRQHMALRATVGISATDRSPCPGECAGDIVPKDAETPRAPHTVPALVFA
jgi:hypothetical protein